MQKMLRSVYISFILIALYFFWVGSISVFAQIVISDGNPMEIRFTDETGIQSSSARHIINLSEIGNILNAEPAEVAADWRLYNPNDNHTANSFIRDERQFVSIGFFESERYRQSLFAASFKNLSSNNLGGMMIAFDFVAHAMEMPANKTLRLMFRVNDGQWQSAEGGLLNTNRMRTDDSEYSTVSIQINLNQIYLRHEDEIQLMWTADQYDDEDRLPVFLQRIEVFPEFSRIAELDRGSVIITEIMPATTVDGTDFEYLEIYNPANEEIQLKGVEIKTSAGSHIIQQDVTLAPYSLLVFSNVDISEINGIRNSYFYNGSLIPASGGRIEIIQQNETIAVATYEASEKGKSLQLNEMINAYDGYTSLTNLVTSEESFFPELTGSPGSAGITIPVYRRTLIQEGWYLLSPPGKLNSRLSRHPSLQYFTLNGDPISHELIEPYAPFFVYKDDREPVTIYAEGIQRRRSTTVPFIEYTMADGIRLISSMYPSQDFVDRVLRNHGLNVPPMIKAWDERAQSFRLTDTEQVTLLDWTPFILPAQSNINPAGNTAGRGGAYDLARNIIFSMFDGEGNNRRLIDHAILGFLPMQVDVEQSRFDLPKILPSYRSPSNRLIDLPFMYLSSPESAEPNNSFIHLPFEIDSEFSVGLGYQMTAVQTSGQAVLEWRINPDIPDEWIIELKDNQTGLTVNMREENNLRFRYTVNQKLPEQDERHVRLTRALVTDRNRFSIDIKPYVTIEEIVEEIRPGNVELRQNYPNPFNPATNITFYLPEERTVRVGIYNIVGQQVAMLIDDNLQAGEHSVSWDASNNPSGIYIVQLETGNRILTRKITLIK